MGGGSGGSSRVAREQLDMERQRVANIQQGINAVNAVFDTPERQQQYQDFLGAQRNLLFDNLRTQQADANRQSRFALARSGLLGSRQQVDMGADMGKAYQRGVVNAENQANNALTNLKNADEDSRARLIQLVQAGGDATTASASALRGMQNNLSGASAQNNVDALGNVFSGFADAYKRSQENQQSLDAMKYLRQLYGTAGQFGYGGQP